MRRDDERAGADQGADVGFQIGGERGIFDQHAGFEVRRQRPGVRFAEPTSARRPSTTRSFA
jgi:hypothetical protein